MTSLIGMALMLGMGSGCGGERPGEAAAGDETDYGDVLRRVREKHADTQKLDRLRTSIEKFQIESGRPPSNIVELVQFGYLKEYPEAPEGMMYQYDPTNGVVRSVRVEPASGAPPPDMASPGNPPR